MPDPAAGPRPRASPSDRRHEAARVNHVGIVDDNVGGIVNDSGAG